MKAGIAIAFWLRRLAEWFDPPYEVQVIQRPKHQKYTPKVRRQLARISRRKNRKK